MLPLAAIGAGLGVASSLKDLVGGGGGMYHNNLNYRLAMLQGQDPGNFKFEANEYDPELGLLRRRASNLGTQRMAGATNELGRAGILGTSQGLDYMTGVRNQGFRDLEDIDSQVFNRQRDEQLNRYQGNINWRRQVLLNMLNAENARSLQNDIGNSQALGDIGGLGGDLLQGWAKKKGWIS